MEKIRLAIVALLLTAFLAHGDTMRYIQSASGVNDQDNVTYTVTANPAAANGTYIVYGRKTYCGYAGAEEAVQTVVIAGGVVTSGATFALNNLYWDTVYDGTPAHVPNTADITNGVVRTATFSFAITKVQKTGVDVPWYGDTYSGTHGIQWIYPFPGVATHNIAKGVTIGVDTPDINQYFRLDATITAPEYTGPGLPPNHTWTGTAKLFINGVEKKSQDISGTDVYLGGVPVHRIVEYTWTGLPGTTLAYQWKIDGAVVASGSVEAAGTTTTSPINWQVGTRDPTPADKNTPPTGTPPPPIPGAGPSGDPGAPPGGGTPGSGGTPAPAPTPPAPTPPTAGGGGPSGGTPISNPNDFYAPTKQAMSDALSSTKLTADVNVINTNDFYEPFKKALNDFGSEYELPGVVANASMPTSTTTSPHPQEPGETSSEISGAVTATTATLAKMGEVKTGIAGMLPSESPGMPTVGAGQWVWHIPMSYAGEAVLDFHTWETPINMFRDLQKMFLVALAWWATVKQIRNAFAS